MTRKRQVYVEGKRQEAGTAIDIPGHKTKRDAEQKMFNFFSPQQTPTLEVLSAL